MVENVKISVASAKKVKCARTSPPPSSKADLKNKEMGRGSSDIEINFQIPQNHDRFLYLLLLNETDEAKGQHVPHAPVDPPLPFF